MKIFSYINIHRVLFSIIIFVAIVGASFGVHIKSAEAVAGVNPGGLAVGGTLMSMTACTCAYTSWLAAMYVYIKGKDLTKSGTYTYSRLLTETHSNYMVRPGSGMLATYIPGVQACWMQAGYICTMLGNRGLLTSIGTGLAP